VPLALLGLNVGSFVKDTIEAIVDLVVPDFGADWVSNIVTWLVALPNVTGPAFPALNGYARDLTAVGFGLLGATAAAGLLQLWAGGLTGAGRPAEALRRAAIAAGVLVSYPIVINTVLVGTNTLTAAMIKHPAVTDGLDKAFGEALVASAITSGVSLGLAVGAAFTLLYFLAALFVLKIGLTAALAVIVLSGALVWGLYPLPQAQWLAQAWTATLVAAITVPVVWACIFAAAALLASDTLVFDGDSTYNNGLGPDLASLVKPFAAVACFWLAYRAPGMLVAVARAAGVGPMMMGGPGAPGGGAGRRGGGGPSGGGRGPEALVRQGAQTNVDRFRAFSARGGATGRRIAPAVAGAIPGLRSGRTTASPGARSSSTTPDPSSTPKPSMGSRMRRLASAPVHANRWWGALPEEGRRARSPKGHPRANGQTATPKRTTSAPTASLAKTPQPTQSSAPASRPMPPPSSLPATRSPSASSSATRAPRPGTGANPPAKPRRSSGSRSDSTAAPRPAAGPTRPTPPPRSAGEPRRPARKRRPPGR
jgi:hypothetical protein